MAFSFRYVFVRGERPLDFGDGCRMLLVSCNAPGDCGRAPFGASIESKMEAALNTYWTSPIAPLLRSYRGLSAIVEPVSLHRLFADGLHHVGAEWTDLGKSKAR